MPTVLNGEVLHETLVAFQPREPNGNSWTTHAAINVLLDRWVHRFEVLESARVDAGQELDANRKPTKYDHKFSITFKGRLDDLTTQSLIAAFEQYDFYLATVYSGGASRQYQLLNTSYSREASENNAVMIEAEFEQAF